MEPTLNETPGETQREGTNLETNGAIESHTTREHAVPIASENETTVQNRENHGNINTVSWGNETIVPLTMKEIIVHLSILFIIIIASQVTNIGMEDAQHWQSVRITPMTGEIQYQPGSRGPFAMPHGTEEHKSFLEKNTSASVQEEGLKLDKNGNNCARGVLGMKDTLRPVGIPAIVKKNRARMDLM